MHLVTSILVFGLGSGFFSTRHSSRSCSTGDSSLGSAAATLSVFASTLDSLVEFISMVAVEISIVSMGIRLLKFSLKLDAFELDARLPIGIRVMGLELGMNWMGMLVKCCTVWLWALGVRLVVLGPLLFCLLK